MDDRLSILWLGPVLGEDTLNRFLAVSPAANRWQIGLIHALQETGLQVSVVGHLPEPAWPRGWLRVKDTDGSLPPSIQGRLTGYWNLPTWRNRSLSSGYRKLIRGLGISETSAGVVVTYNASPANVAGAAYARERYDMPWVCIVADGGAPPDADGYVFLSWRCYQAFNGPRLKLHLDGGVSEIRFSPQASACESQSRRKVVMYTGAMTPYAGAAFLVRAFHQSNDPQAELWICGKGSNPDVERIAAIDARIKLWGFVSENELTDLMQRADVFVNPRPSNIAGNKRNFPSKVLEYLPYGKPVISTWTEGLSPEYHDVLVVLERETEECLSATIQTVLNWDAGQRQLLIQKVAQFLENRLWRVQAGRFLNWLMQISTPGGES